MKKLEELDNEEANRKGFARARKDLHKDIGEGFERGLKEGGMIPPDTEDQIK